jgi:NitT/TauT family transport system permease protein
LRTESPSFPSLAAPGRSTQARHRFSPAARHHALVWTGRLVIVFIVCCVWEFVARTKLMNPVFIGIPTEIFKSFITILTGSVLRVDATATVVSTLIGFAIAATFGIATAMVLTQLPVLDEMVQPFFTALNSMPRVALAPLFVMWFGVGFESKVALSASLVFFVVLLNTMAGIQGVDRDHVALARSLGARPLEIFLKIKLPSAVPSIFAGMELGMIYGFLGTVAGEMLAGAKGLGVRLQEYSGMFRTNDFFAVLLLLVCITTAIAILLRFVRRKLLRWQTLGSAARATA